MVCYCKRCGRELRSAKSIQLGYGPVCYKIVQFETNHDEMEKEIRFLQMEIKMIKKILRGLKDGTVPSPTSYAHNQAQQQGVVQTRLHDDVPDFEPIRPILQSQPNPTGQKGHMQQVIQELKNCFQNCKGDVKSLLTPIITDKNPTNASSGILA